MEPAREQLYYGRSHLLDGAYAPCMGLWAWLTGTKTAESMADIGPSHVIVEPVGASREPTARRR
jgi:hypothetical protein